VKEVFWASGACMMIRRSVWRQIGGLDDDFFMHMEEIDWCWRAHLCGYKLYCVPQSVVYHVGAGTLTKQNPRKTYFNYRNNLLMLQKNLSCVTAWRVLLFRLILDHLSLYRHLAHGHFAICTGILLAHRDFLVHQPKWVRKRMANQKFLRNVNPQVRFGLDFPRVVYNGDIVVDHFLKQKESFSELKL